ncbi:phage Gp37/Gp68 family protein [Ancylobacter sp. IITR112]|uniref:phage Gp37/Gp68 family protein n=1 Tax=Ancylobacter sp. IITR112 TaxID=3138073 RepID=UPI00352AD028
MGDHTGIEWADATWNPIVGCSIVSPGCTNCYAMGQAARIERMQPASHYAGTTQSSKAGAIWSGKLKVAPDHILTQPLHWRRPRRIFVNSMGDLFHEDAPDHWIDRVFAIMALAPQHTFMVLTKRSARMRDYVGTRAGDWMLHWPDAARKAGALLGDVAALGAVPFPIPNVWLGVSTEDQRRADERVPDLLAAPASIRFVSAEPLLGPLNLRRIRIAPNHHTMLDALDGYAITENISGSGQERAKLDLVIVGGESGPKARPMHPDWARSLRDQCAAAGTAFFFKQWGEWLHEDLVRDGQHPGARFFSADDGPMDEAPPFGPTTGRLWHWWEPDHKASIRVGKRAAGRLLDGVEHNAMPEVRS